MSKPKNPDKYIEVALIAEAAGVSPNAIKGWIQRQQLEPDVRAYAEAELGTKLPSPSSEAFTVLLMELKGSQPKLYQALAKSLRECRHMAWTSPEGIDYISIRGADLYMSGRGIPRLRERPKGWPTVKAVKADAGIGGNKIYHLIRDGTLKAGYYRGVIYIEPESAAWFKREQKNLKPPPGWELVVDLVRETDRNRGALKAWIRTNKIPVRYYLHPSMCRLARYIPAQDAERYRKMVAQGSSKHTPKIYQRKKRRGDNCARFFAMNTLKAGFLLMALVISSLSLAQPAPYVRTTFDLTQLDSRPGRITVSPDYLTVIEFEDVVSQVATGRADLLQVEVQDNRILLRPTRNVGGTDLVVTVGGRTALFVIDVEADAKIPRRYVVGIPPRPTPITQTQRGRAGIISERSEPPVQSEVPESLSFDINVLYVPNGEIVIQYALHNTGDNPIANDPLRLQLLFEDRKVPYTHSRVATGGNLNRLFFGDAEYGTIVIEDPPGGQITLEWTLVEIGPGNHYILRRTVNEGLARSVR